MPPAVAVDLISQAAEALDAAHARGVVHRDVKPANMLITRNGHDHVYLTDFGLGKLLDRRDISSAAEPGTFLGTLAYAAPEQIRGEKVDRRIDVYALGCVLFHALTGHAPFERETDVAIMYAHLEEPPPVATRLVPELPQALDAAVARSMAKDPAEQPPASSPRPRLALYSAPPA